MGNVDLTADKKLMESHVKHMEDFGKEKPLFNAEDIKFPLSTHNAKIVDSTGRRVKLAGGNWSGGHMCRHCVDGLECRTLVEIATDIRHKFMMNCVRLTYSLQLFYDNNVVPEKYLKANPALIGKTAMEIFDETVKVLTDVGLMVILNNHTSTSQWCCSNDDGDGLWWSYEYPEYKFFQCAEEFARRYKDNPRVIGMDLRNEIRKANGRDPTWGDGNPLTDWHRAAKLSGEKVLKIAPHWLIFVGGLNYQLDLTCVIKNPLVYSIPNKLVYSGHFYSFSWPIPAWGLVSYDQFKKKLFNSQTFIRGLGYPYLLGEFGNNQRDTPWKYLMRYLREEDVDWTYWALDGFKCDPDKDETYGVFSNNFKQARHPELLADMIAAGPPHGTHIRLSKDSPIMQLDRPKERASEINFNTSDIEEMPILQHPSKSTAEKYTEQKRQKSPRHQHHHQHHEKRNYGSIRKTQAEKRQKPQEKEKRQVKQQLKVDEENKQSQMKKEQDKAQGI